MRDDHPLTTMQLVSIDYMPVNPFVALQRAQGRLILPHMKKTIQREIELLKKA